MSVLAAAISPSSSLPQQPNPEKRVYAPLTPSPLNPNAASSSSRQPPQAPPSNTTPDKQRSPADHGRTSNKTLLPPPAASAQLHRYAAAVTAQESPGKRLMRQKAAAAWRCETLQHHFLQPAASSLSSNLRFELPGGRQQHHQHHRLGASLSLGYRQDRRRWGREIQKCPGRCSREGCACGECEREAEEENCAAGLGVIDLGRGKPAAGGSSSDERMSWHFAGGSRTQKAVEQALLAAESYRTRWRTELVVPMFDDDSEDEDGGEHDEGVSRCRDGEDDEGEKSSLVNHDGHVEGRRRMEQGVPAAEEKPDTEKPEKPAVVSSPEFNRQSIQSDKEHSLGVVVHTQQAETITTFTQNLRKSDIEVGPDVGLLLRRRQRQLFIERGFREFVHTTRARISGGGKRLRSRVRRLVVFIAAVVIGVALTHGMVMTVLRSGGGSAIGDAVQKLTRRRYGGLEGFTAASGYVE